MAQDFLARMKARGKQCVENTNEVVKQVALAVDKQVVTASPRDTGRFVSNWLPSMDAPATITQEPYLPGKDGSTGNACVAAAIAEANRVIATRKPGQDIWISNNLPYAQRLNEGYSPQAPANFVEQGIKAGLGELRRAKILN